jgi:DNA-binding response OmpR family regulator
MKILFIEDEESLRKPVKRYLEKKNFQVDETGDGKEGLNLALRNEYDCILLDLNLPGLDGIEISKSLKKEDVNTPIIMVTARSQLYNRLEGFEHGADDYVTKPFNLQELVARINAVIRRSSTNSESILKFAHFEVYEDMNVVRDSRRNIDIELSNKEMGILEYLLRNKGKIISSEELLEHVWDREVDMFSQTVKTHIKTLRQKVDPSKKYIHTVRGKGYQIKI